MADSQTNQTRQPGTRPAAPLWTAAWELLLPTAAAPPRQRGHTLQAALRDAVRSGVLASGTRLPPSRELAADLRVSRGLITDAYAQLTAEGYLVSRTGAGTWVAELPAAVPGPHPAPSSASAAPEADFRPGVPDLALFPRAAWSAAHRRAVARLPNDALGYPDPRGLPELRTALAGLLARRRGIAVDPDGLIVCSGVAQALTLVSHVARTRGHRLVATEDPGGPEALPLYAACGLNPVPVPVDGDGLDVDALAATGAGIAVVTPSHQFPSGIAYSAGRRAGLVGWARSAGGLLVEDDYDGEFRYDREPVGALQGLAPGHVAYTGSVSKSLAPGLRLGWLVPPPGWMEALTDLKRTADLGNPAPEQAVLAEFITSGQYDRHLRRAQRLYRTRRNTLLDALRRHFPDVTVSGIAAGLHLIAHFPPRYGDEAALVSRAARAGMRIRPLADYTAAPRHGTDLVLGYAHRTASDIEQGIAALASALGP